MQMRSIMRGIGLLLVVSIAFGQDITSLVEKHREAQVKQKIKKESINQKIEDLRMQEEEEKAQHSIKLMRMRREEEIKEAQHSIKLMHMRREEELNEALHSLRLMHIQQERELAQAKQIKVNMQGYTGKHIFVKNGLVLLDGSDTPLGRINLSAMKIGNFYMENPLISIEQAQIQKRERKIPEIPTPQPLTSPVATPQTQIILPSQVPLPPPPPPPPPR